MGDVLSAGCYSSLLPIHEFCGASSFASFAYDEVVGVQVVVDDNEVFSGEEALLFEELLYLPKRSVQGLFALFGGCVPVEVGCD